LAGYGAGEDVIDMYEDYLRETPELMAALPERRLKVLERRCAPEPCRGDVLVTLANG
jgi:hypothetical protein